MAPKAGVNGCWQARAVGMGRASFSQLKSRSLREIRGDLDAVRNAVAACLARSAPGRSRIALRVLDFGVARRLGCAPMGTRDRRYSGIRDLAQGLRGSPAAHDRAGSAHSKG